ncbi:MAG: DUF1579 family protein [Candidatus Acidiferrales bacterium]
MHRKFATFLFVILTLPVIASAQNPPAAPKPGPEVKKLEIFVGTWTDEGEIKPGMFAATATKFTNTTHIEWMEGGFFLIGHSEETSSMGTEKSMAIWGYDTEKKVYTYNEFASNGETIAATGTLDGDTWSWTSEASMGGKMFKSRYTVKQVSPTSYTSKLEMQPEGGAWSTVFESKATKK